MEVNDNLEEKIVVNDETSEVEKYENLYMKALADLDNYRRTSVYRMTLKMKAYRIDVIKNVIAPSYNDIYRGCIGNNENTGLNLIMANYKSDLDKFGLIVVDDLVGKEFDPNTMEVVGLSDDSNEDKKVSRVVGVGFIDKCTNDVYVHAKVVL